MRTSKLLRDNLTYYWRTNLAVVFGVATAVAVLAGALLVGDSVRASLRDLVLLRLGRTSLVVSAPGFFREKLADDLRANGRFAANFEAACPLVALEGAVTDDESGRRGSGVQVYGVDERFWKFHGLEGKVRPPGDDDILVSGALAAELDSRPGSTLLLRIEKPSAIPAESLHGRKEDLGRTIRFRVRETLGRDALGEFSLRPQQSAVRAVFVPLRRLQRNLEQDERVNTVLVSAEGGTAEALSGALKESFTLADVGLKVRAVAKRHGLSLESGSTLLGDALAGQARAAAGRLGMPSSFILTYLANTIRSGAREVPYSLVTAVDENLSVGLDADRAGSLPPIALNDWTARELGAKVGDEVSLDYYLWQEGGGLKTETARFRVTSVVGLDGVAGDPDLAPEYPGITASMSLSDWDPPFPMDLERVRPSDEAYWDRYRTTPKAFIPLAAGRKLWASRFGALTSVRVSPPAGSDLEVARADFERGLRAELDPARLGLAITAPRAEGLAASRGATDFGEYFTYFSFFLVVSALLLASLFFKLGVEQRLREIGLLGAIGFPAAKIRALFLAEGLVLAVLGSLAGVVGALLYGALMMLGLRTWWRDAVGTQLLSLRVSPLSLAVGALGGVAAALLCIAWTLRSLAPASPRSLLSGSLPEKGRTSARVSKSRGFPLSPSLLLSLCSATAAAALLAGAALGRVGQVAGFFGAGAALLLALLGLQAAQLRRGRGGRVEGAGWLPVARLGFRNVTSRPSRSLLCIALVAAATFIIVAVDAFRRDPSAAGVDRRSGGGGYPLLAESLVPLIHDPNTAAGREDLNLSGAELEGVTFARFRLRPGDDASCLNLYQPRNPRILAPTDDFRREGRFAFQGSLARGGAEAANPWLLLEEELPDGAIPVIADANSLTYVLHLKLGDDLTVSAGSGEAVRLRPVAALADSIFQSELLMSERNFVRLFPEQEGYRFFLIDVAPEKAGPVGGALEGQLTDFGFDAVPTAERLAGFHRVENTYLSTFQTLGGLGLLLGTLGLATVLLRNVLERRRELALLRAVGYRPAHFALMVIAENAWLLFRGLLTGAVAAGLAIMPALLARGGHAPTLSLGLLLLSVLATGLLASVAATAAALRSPLLPALRSE